MLLTLYAVDVQDRARETKLETSTEDPEIHVSLAVAGFN